ncbi:uncharacterized protein LOC117121609 isoform X2 [Anneissia japonica]|uniref:uncharacterized protein LOC117121609 isoform X2 n=1 Tax=Anneissia japonica TaxID=1529436 RepID=UPI00142582E7|nr:uncharacterized protein LOC117121609 isoform X2 [Anneissia japonica]
MMQVTARDLFRSLLEEQPSGKPKIDRHIFATEVMLHFEEGTLSNAIVKEKVMAQRNGARRLEEGTYHKARKERRPDKLRQLERDHIDISCSKGYGQSDN